MSEAGSPGPAMASPPHAAPVIPHPPHTPQPPSFRKLYCKFILQAWTLGAKPSQFVRKHRWPGFATNLLVVRLAMR